MRDLAPPDSYVVLEEGQARIVCVQHLADLTRAAIQEAGSLYEYARRRPDARPLAGRGTSYAIQFPDDGERAVIRHNRHGGLLAPITGDLFRPPTRAPLELIVSERLRERGVSTPLVLGYVTYPGPAGFQRADVMTREVTNGEDLSAALMSDDQQVRARALRATAALLVALEHAGARHHDLNIKNVLLQEAGGDARAYVLDVDRVVFGGAGTSVLEANLARLLRSARKWQAQHGARVTDQELADLSAMAHEGKGVPLATLS